MDARLFFAMVRRGREVQFRRQSRIYFHLLSVADFPNMTKESRDKTRQWHWDNSLTAGEIEDRNTTVQQVREEAKKHYSKPEAALGFFAQGNAKK